VCRAGDLANVAPVIGIQGILCRAVKFLKRAEQVAKARARIDAGVGGGGLSELRQANAAECVAEAIARNDVRRSDRRDFDIRRAGWQDNCP
jgi:hypothetical protein